MENLLRQLREKSDKHLEKIKVHEGVKKELELRYSSLEENDPARERVSEQLLSTMLSIEYHKGSAKTYLKAVEMIEKEIR